MALKWFKKDKDKSDQRTEKQVEEAAEIEELDALEITNRRVHVL